VELDAIYFCPHHPDAGCRCRKPGIELLERAAEDLVLDLPSSVVIGDKLLDVETARNARATGVLVRTGYGLEQERRAGAGGATPAHVADDLGSAVDWLLAREGLGTL
jgi:histidinol phosphatase-like enzyme